MELENKSNMSKKFIFLCFILISVFILRAFFSINTTDEAFNIGESFRTVLGVSFLTENWDFFQTGDSFMFPFLKLFYLITGSSKGIFLFSRIIYILLVFVFFSIEYKLLKKQFGAKKTIAALLVFYTALSLKMYVFFYDNAELMFQLLGLILIFHYYSNHNEMSSNEKMLCITFAGMSHAAMVYSYPTMVVTVLYVSIVLFVYTPEKTNRWKQFFSYALGLASIFALFLVLLLIKGPENLFIFNQEASSSGLSERGYIFSIFGIINSLRNLIVGNGVLYRKALLTVVPCIITAIFFNRKKWKVFVVMLMEIVGSIIILKDYGIAETDVANHLMMFLSAFSFVIVFLLNKEHQKTAWMMILTIQIPSYLCGVMYACTAWYGSLKLSQGGKASVIVALMLTFLLIEENIEKEKISQIFTTSIMFAFVLMNGIILISSAYYGSDPLKCNTIIKSGPYAGLIDTEEVAAELKTFEDNLSKIITDKDKTITFGEGIHHGYMETKLKPNTNYLWGPGARDGIVIGKNPNILKRYYNEYYGYADIIVIKDGEVETRSPSFMEFLNSEYNLAFEDNGYFFYVYS